MTLIYLDPGVVATSGQNCLSIQMSLSEQQNQAVTQLLIEFYNNLLVDIMKQLFEKACSSLRPDEQVEALQMGMIETLKQSANQAFSKTKSSLFNFIADRQSAKLTESSFKNIFDKYFLPQSLIHEYKQRPNDVVLQMGMTLIVQNVKMIFQDRSKAKQYIKLMSRDTLSDSCFIDQLTPIIEKIQLSMHKYLLGEPITTITKTSTQPCSKCKKLQKKTLLLEEAISLIERQNSMLKQMIEDNQKTQLPMIPNEVDQYSNRKNDHKSQGKYSKPKQKQSVVESSSETSSSDQDQRTSNASGKKTTGIQRFEYKENITTSQVNKQKGAKINTVIEPMYKKQESLNISKRYSKDISQQEQRKLERGLSNQKQIPSFEEIKQAPSIRYSRAQLKIESDEESSENEDQSSEGDELDLEEDDQSSESDSTQKYDEGEQQNIKKIDTSQQRQLTDQLSLIV